MNVKTRFRRPTREDLIDLASASFREGRFDSIESLAEDLGIARATAYKWVGNSDQLLEQVMVDNTVQRFEEANGLCKSTGAQRIWEILMAVSRAYVKQKALQTLARKNPERMMRVVATKSGNVQPTTVGMTEALIREELDAGRLDISLDAHTMAYVLVRICESFLYGDLIAGEEVDLDKQEIALRTMLGDYP